jgi:hypothetical protein
MSNWLTNAINAGNAVNERKHCFITGHHDDDGRRYYSLADYETGEPVLGEFLNTYGAWGTVREAHAEARRNGYRCSRKVDWRD